MKRFIDTNIFIYSATNHPKFGEKAKEILKRIEEGEGAVTSTLVLCEVAWVLEAMGRQGDIKPTLEKILSYKNLEIIGFDQDDILLAANNMHLYGIDFNDGLNTAIMTKIGVYEAYSNDQKHLGKVDTIKIIFE
jgi:predicted nucleic acid-binding protein